MILLILFDCSLAHLAPTPASIEACVDACGERGMLRLVNNPNGDSVCECAPNPEDT